MTATVQEIKGNMVGTTSIIMRIKGMRKDQSFIVYPINKESQILTIQSGTRIANVSIEGMGQMSKSHANGAYFHHLSIDKLTLFNFTFEDWQKIKKAIGLTESLKAGNNVIHSDNSAAKSIFEL